MYMTKEERSPKYNPLYKKIYRLHNSMMNRCYSEKNGSYKNYGARGITVDERWHEFDRFLEDIDSIEGFDEDKLLNGEIQLDKDIKNKDNKVYSLENCMFVSAKENASNRRNSYEIIVVNLDENINMTINSLQRFCEENDLDLRTCWKILNKKGRSKTHKGYQFFKKDEFKEEDIYMPKTYIGIYNETGEETEFTNLKQFVIDNNLSSSSAVNACLRGDQRNHKGWSFRLKK